MKKCIPIICSCLIFLFVAAVFGQVIEDVDPTVAQFSIVRGDGDPGYNGDLNFSIPLASVPSRNGLSFDLILQYVMGNGVPASQSASVVGLGWNLNLPEITCIPAYYFDNQNPDNVWQERNDMYHLSMPGVSAQIYNFGEMNETNEDWQALNWVPLSIHATYVTNVTFGTKTIPYDVGSFTVIDANGIKYIFDRPLVTESTTRLANHCRTGTTPVGDCPDHDAGDDHLHPYRYVFKLTKILGPDYVDLGSAGVDDSDTGSWIEFTYSNGTTLSLRTDTNSNSRHLSQEVDYLSQISSPIYDVYLHYGDLQRQMIFNNLQETNTPNLRTLDYIGLSDGRRITFDTDLYFPWVKFEYNAFQYVKISTQSYIKRLRLKGIQFTGENNEAMPPYQFSYYDGPDLADGANTCKIDQWGYFQIQDEPTGMAVDKYWMLKRVTYPTGGYVEYDYESDRYQFPNPSENMDMIDNLSISGGLRLIQKRMYDPQIQSTSTYTYSYASSNKRHPGYGFISQKPLIELPYLYAHAIPHNRMGMDLKRDVHYPDISITYPNGSIQKKYYTCAFTNVAGDPDKYADDIKKIDRYHWYSLCEEHVECETDNDLDSLYTANKASIDASYNGYGYMYYQNNYLYGTCSTWVPGCDYLYSTKNAFINEAKEFHDQNDLMGDYWVQLYDNSWKRGYLTKEEYYEVEGGNEFLKKEVVHYYRMTPRMTIAYLNQHGWISLESPAAITSGWVKEIQTSTYEDGEMIADTRYSEWNDLNGKPEYMAERLGYSEDYNGQIIYKAVRNKYVDPVSTYSEMASPEVFQVNTVVQNTVGVEFQNYIYQPEIRVPVASSVTTYVKWDNLFWKPKKTYRWDTSPGDNSIPAFDFENDSDTGEPGTSEWLRTSKILDRDAHGNILAMEDAKGVVTRARWDEDHSAYPLSQITNARPEDYCAESYESESEGPQWPLEGGQITADKAHTGTYSVLVAAGYGPTKSFSISGDQGIDKTIKYIADAWIYRSSGSARIRIGITNTSGTEVSAQNVTISSGSGWQYIRVGMEPYQMGNANMQEGWHLKVQCGFPDGGSGYVDDIRFYPQQALMTTRTYDDQINQVTSVSDVNNMATIYKYDGLVRLDEVWNYHHDLVTDYDYYYSANESNNYIYSIVAPNCITTRMFPLGTADDNDPITRTYYDGLGRAIQTNVHNGVNDIISKTAYNSLGQLYRKYLPYEVPNSEHDFSAAIHKDGILHLSEQDMARVTYGWAEDVTISDVDLNTDDHASLRVRADDSINITNTSIPEGVHAQFIASQDHWPYESYEYDKTPMQRLEKLIHPENSANARYFYTTSSSYYNETLFEKETCNENNVEVSEYFDNFNNLVYTRQASNKPSSDRIEWHQEYDVFGNVTHVYMPESDGDATNATFKIDYDYNSLGQLVEKRSPADEGTTRYRYDKNGNLRFTQNDAQRTSGYFTVYRYDAQNRIMYIAEERSTEYSWTTSANEPNPDSDDYGTSYDEWLIRNTYDGLPQMDLDNISQGRLVATSIYQDNDNLTDHMIKYSYDEMGNVKEKDINIDLSGSDELVNKIISIQYDLLGRETSITYPSGTTYEKTYDQAGRVKTIEMIQ